MLVYRSNFATQRNKKNTLVDWRCMWLTAKPTQCTIFFARRNCTKSVHDGPFATPLATTKPQCHELDLFLEKLMLWHDVKLKRPSQQQDAVLWLATVRKMLKANAKIHPIPILHFLSLTTSICFQHARNTESITFRITVSLPFGWLSFWFCLSPWSLFNTVSASKMSFQKVWRRPSLSRETSYRECLELDRSKKDAIHPQHRDENEVSRGGLVGVICLKYK